ncbi:DsrE family protein [Caballeronia sp. LZ032]|uniref:DsrE family protein n=1 Tax=Caballeronia sp. LZ032 TaxID=3038565 RepID=UPI0038D4C3EA
MTQNRNAVQTLIGRFGNAQLIEDSVHRPDPLRSYRIVFSVTSPSNRNDQPNSGLERVARAIDLFLMSGVPTSQLDCVAILHGEATPCVLNEACYQAYDGVGNPNGELIAALQAVNVEVTVCAQALLARGFSPNGLLPSVTRSLSALTTLAILQCDGYGLIAL